MTFVILPNIILFLAFFLMDLLLVVLIRVMIPDVYFFITLFLLDLFSINVCFLPDIFLLITLFLFMADVFLQHDVYFLITLYTLLYMSDIKCLTDVYIQDIIKLLDIKLYLNVYLLCITLGVALRAGLSCFAWSHWDTMSPPDGFNP